ncbi:hypothetical protein N0V90_005541 [Kalmusia sp. IMI 367209]|nr:hypothetical protein N0V90_005541 [Kalmusia sp. IMI 367209]
MWSSTKFNSAMRSSSSSLPLAAGRPWTPPEIDSDCFPDALAHSPTPGLDADDGSLQSSRLQSEPTDASSRPKLESSATEPAYPRSMASQFDGESVAGYFSGLGLHAPSHIPGVEDIPAHSRHTYVSDPHTPIKTPWSSGLLQNDTLPQYPYTPESIRTTKSHVFRPLSPPPSMPWDAESHSSESSPVQHALSSCVSHLENLIQTREPNDDQMEYLISKFEEMARVLSAPEAQTKQTDDHLFSEPELPQDATGSSSPNDEAANAHPDAQDVAMSQGYILEVGRYIESVKTHVEDLTMRMDEVKQLNSIQLDIIDDLRRELKTKSSQLKQEMPEPPQKRKLLRNIPPQRKGFWSAVGEALDSVGVLLHEW